VGKKPPQSQKGGSHGLTLRPAGKPNYFYFLFFIFYILFFAPSGLAPRTSAGLSHGSPRFEFEVAFCPPPTSYLYYYIRLLMSLISLFFFALTFGKPLTCEKEDFIG
jgi:hypothetical protein